MRGPMDQEKWRRKATKWRNKRHANTTHGLAELNHPPAEERPETGRISSWRVRAQHLVQLPGSALQERQHDTFRETK